MCDSIRTTTTTRRMRRFRAYDRALQFTSYGAFFRKRLCRRRNPRAARATLPLEVPEDGEGSRALGRIRGHSSRICRRDPHTHPAARHARAPLHAVRADPRALARRAVALHASVRANLRPLANLAVRAHALMLADRAPAAVLALVTHAFVLAYARPAALRARVPDPVVLAHRLAPAVAALGALAVVLADTLSSALATVVPVRSTAVRTQPVLRGLRHARAGHAKPRARRRPRGRRPRGRRAGRGRRRGRSDRAGVHI